MSSPVLSGQSTSSGAVRILRTITNYIMFSWPRPRYAGGSLLYIISDNQKNQNVSRPSLPNHLFEEWLQHGGSVLLGPHHQHHLLLTLSSVHQLSLPTSRRPLVPAQPVAALPVCLTWVHTVSACMGRSDKGGQSSFARPPGVSRRHCTAVEQTTSTKRNSENEAGSHPGVSFRTLK